MLKKHLPRNFVWSIIKAKRTHKKGTAKGGFLIGIKKGWCQVEGEAGTEVTEGLIKSKISVGREMTQMNIWSIYNNGNLEMIWQQIEEDNYGDKEVTLVMGDFNIRIGDDGSYMKYDEPGEVK